MQIMPKNLKIYSKCATLLFLIAFLVFGNFTISKAQITTPSTTPSPILEKKLVFSEINWSGSNKSSDDEWLELFNNSDIDLNLEGFSIQGVLSASKFLNLKGIVKNKEYFLISKFSNEDSKSNLNIIPDLIEPKLSISNSKLDLKLFENGSLIDEINTNNQKPFAGSLSPNSSMERIDYQKDGNDPSNWKTSNSRQNLKGFETQTCNLDFATPKANFNENNSNIVCKINGTFDLFSDESAFEAKEIEKEIINFESNEICNTKNFCKIEIPIKLISGNNLVLKSLFGTKDSTDEFQKVLVNKSNFNSENIYNLVFSIDGDSSKDLGIKIILNKNTKVEIGKAKFYESEKVLNKTFVSKKNLNWQNIIKLNSKTSAQGFNGQILDILESKSRLSKGKYSLSYRIKKVENFNTADDLINISGFDERGNRLFESVIDENDLKYNESKSISISYDLKSFQKIRIIIEYYGNHSGAQADIEFGGIILQ